jgi:hypothetical protein
MIAYFFSISQNPTGYDKVLVRNLCDTGVVDFIAWMSVSPRYQRHLTYVKANRRSYRDLGHGQIDIQAFAGFRGNAPPHAHALSLRRRGRSKCCKGKMLTVNWRLMGVCRAYRETKCLGPLLDKRVKMVTKQAIFQRETTRRPNFLPVDGRANTVTAP